MMRWQVNSLVMLGLVLGAALASAAGNPATTFSLAEGEGAGAPQLTIVDRSSGRMTLELDIPSVDITQTEVDGRLFATLAIDGAELAGELGRAALPVYTRLVALPAGASARVTVTGKQMTSLPALTLAPRQAEQEPGKAAPAFAFDAAWYDRAPRTEVAPAPAIPA